MGQLDQVIFALPDADVDEDVVAEHVCYPQQIIHQPLRPKVPCSLPAAPRWFDGLTMEEIRTATLELLIQKQQRWGTPLSILDTTFKWNITVVKIKLGKEKAVKMWCGDGPWEEKWGEVYDGVLHECYVSDCVSSDCEVPDTALHSNWLKCTKQKKKKTRKKTKNQHH